MNEKLKEELKGKTSLEIAKKIDSTICCGGTGFVEWIAAIIDEYAALQQQAHPEVSEYNRGYKEGYADALDQHGIEANPDLEG